VVDQLCKISLFSRFFVDKNNKDREKAHSKAFSLSLFFI